MNHVILGFMLYEISNFMFYCIAYRTYKVADLYELHDFRDLYYLHLLYDIHQELPQFCSWQDDLKISFIGELYFKLLSD